MVVRLKFQFEINSCTFTLQSRDLSQYHKIYLHSTKNKLSLEDFFNKCDEMCSFLRIWSHLKEKLSIENFIFCVVLVFRLIFLLAPFIFTLTLKLDQQCIYIFLISEDLKIISSLSLLL